MQIGWDEEKRQKILTERRIDFANLYRLLAQPYIEDQKNDDPEQYRIIGKLEDRCMTFVVEYEEDDLGELLWVVTAWNSTKQERDAYDKETSSYQK